MSEMSAGVPQGAPGHYHSSSTVMHYSSSAGGEAPKVYTATSSVTGGPGGVSCTHFQTVIGNEVVQRTKNFKALNFVFEANNNYGFGFCQVINSSTISQLN